MRKIVIQLLFFIVLLKSYCIVCEDEIESKNNFLTEQTQNFSDDCTEDNCDDHYYVGECNDSDKFLDNIEKIHKNGLNKNISKYVEHINETFDILSNLDRGSTQLFLSGRKTIFRITEFLSTNNDLSNACLQSIVRISTGIQNREFWALKCKF